MSPPAPLGAIPIPGGTTAFRVWAPACERVEVVVDGIAHPLAAEGAGTFAAPVEASAGARYTFRLDGGSTWPDPCARAMPDGVQGASQVVDPPAFAETDAERAPVTLDDLVLYELHIGTFTDAGTFAAAAERLPGLVELGVTAVEVMPIATFPGERGWGYDGLYTWAPHPAYGGPAGFAAFVHAAHALGLAVILDVVYNHVGPGSEAIAAFGPYFTDRFETFWGSALDYAARGVREWAIQNAEHWVRDYRVDGLRLDATHAVFDDTSPHVLAELATRVRAIRPTTLVISEMETGDERPIREWGHDAQWADELHHELHVLLTDEHEGYYADYGSVAGLAAQVQREHVRRHVVCAQNHDQVGNRAFGDRLRGRPLRLAAFASILSPGIPLLFMGEEHDESHPFQFFTDHIDPEIAHATREGRRREFARFAAFADQVPDPQSPDTFARSKLDWSGADLEHRRYYRALLALRRRLRSWPVGEVRVDERGGVVEIDRGPVTLVMNFSGQTRAGVPPLTGAVRNAERLAG